MSDRRRLSASVVHAHVGTYLHGLPHTLRQNLYAAVAESLATTLDAVPTAVLHPYLHGPAGCRQTIGGVACALPKDDDIHAWPFGDPVPVPERTWHVRRWLICNPAAPAEAFDSVNPVTVESWTREDWDNTDDDVVVWWQDRHPQGTWSVFYGGWDAEKVTAAWQADRDRLVAAGGFVKLPFGPCIKPADELLEEPDDCDDCYY